MGDRWTCSVHCSSNSLPFQGNPLANFVVIYCAHRIGVTRLEAEERGKTLRLSWVTGKQSVRPRARQRSVSFWRHTLASSVVIALFARGRDRCRCRYRTKERQVRNRCPTQSAGAGGGSEGRLNFRQKCDTFSRSSDAVFELSMRFSAPFTYADGMDDDKRLAQDELTFLELTQVCLWGSKSLLTLSTSRQEAS